MACRPASEAAPVESVIADVAQRGSGGAAATAPPAVQVVQRDTRRGSAAHVALGKVSAADDCRTARRHSGSDDGDGGRGEGGGSGGGDGGAPSGAVHRGSNAAAAAKAVGVSSASAAGGQATTTPEEETLTSHITAAANTGARPTRPAIFMGSSAAPWPPPAPPATGSAVLALPPSPESWEWKWMQRGAPCVPGRFNRYPFVDEGRCAGEVAGGRRGATRRSNTLMTDSSSPFPESHRPHPHHRRRCLPLGCPTHPWHPPCI